MWASSLALLAPLLMLLGVALAQDDGYYPNLPGTSWTYDSGETQTLSGPRTIDGVEAMVLTHYFDGVPVSEDYLLFGRVGVLSIGTAQGGQMITYVPPLQVYGPGPLVAGQRWESVTTVGNMDIQLSAEVLGIRGVETPAGRFNALMIRQLTTTSSGGRTLLDLYFVPTVGVVRFVTDDGTTIDLIERTP